jgi:8-oxo-dGTP diphosphatase
MAHPDASGEEALAVACGVAIDERGRILIAQRAGGSLAGQWEFAGGKIQAGESAQEALQREWLEELDCRIQCLSALPPCRHRYEWGSVELWPFVVQLIPGSQPRALEHSQLRWVSRSEIASLPLAAADLPVLEQLCKRGLF